MDNATQDDMTFHQWCEYEGLIQDGSEWIYKDQQHLEKPGRLSGELVTKLYQCYVYQEAWKDFILFIKRIFKFILKKNPMTLAKAEHFQNDFKKLLEKYGVQGAGCFFVHNDQIHMIESHGIEKNQWVVAIMDSLQNAIPAVNPNIPVVNFNNAQGN